jgi:hypothetical protein
MTETETLAATVFLTLLVPIPSAFENFYKLLRGCRTHTSDISTQSVPAAGECKDYIYTHPNPTF